MRAVLQEVPGLSIPEKTLTWRSATSPDFLAMTSNEEQPLLDARLPDGSRVAAVLPPCSVGGPALAIRKFQTRHFDLQELVRVGTMTPEMLTTIQAAVQARSNILLSGRTGAGKTTCLNALTGLIDENERIVVIEDTSELQVEQTERGPPRSAARSARAAGRDDSANS